jgi:hypothetical protein
MLKALTGVSMPDSLFVDPGNILTFIKLFSPILVLIAHDSLID